MTSLTPRWSRSVLLAAATVAAAGSVASADMFTFSYTDGFGTVATGNLVANDIGGGIMHCTAGDITVSAGPLAGAYMTLSAIGPGVTTSPMGLFNVDNLLYPGSPTLDSSGLLFSDGVSEMNIWNDGGGVAYTLWVGNGGAGYFYQGSQAGAFVISPSVPAPGAAAALGVGLLASARRRRA